LENLAAPTAIVVCFEEQDMKGRFQLINGGSKSFTRWAG
jgi:hypothetical protein